MDNAPEAGANKNKEVATIEFKKANDGSFYLVVNSLKSGISNKCTNCDGARKNKTVADGETKWGENFKFDSKKRMFVGGNVYDIGTGNKFLNSSIKVINATTMELYLMQDNRKRTITLLKV